MMWPNICGLSDSSEEYIAHVPHLPEFLLALVEPKPNGTGKERIASPMGHHGEACCLLGSCPASLSHIS